MSETTTFLEKIHVTNFLSLKKVELPLKPLTVIVGPNASGKSNVLNALSLLNQMMNYEELPSVEYIQDCLWGNKARHITFQLQAEIEKKTCYI